VSYAQRHFPDRASRERFARMERTLIAATRDCERVLDLGCGAGRLMPALEARRVIGLDIARELLAEARLQLPSAQLVLGDGNALPFRAEVFDGVVAADSAFALLDMPRALRECGRVLRPGGVLALHHKAIRVWSLRRGLLDVPGAVPADAPDRLLASAQAAGFAIEVLRLYRWLRIPPYLVRIPVPPRISLWNHGVFVFRKRLARGSRAVSA
jgi:ubiquinone/menaquinone biosynthesis C-methylase UbiE